MSNNVQTITPALLAKFPVFREAAIAKHGAGYWNVRVLLCVLYLVEPERRKPREKAKGFRIGYLATQVWGGMGGIFFCRVAIFNALGTIEGSCLEVHAA